MSRVTITLVSTIIFLCAWCRLCATISNTTTPMAPVFQPAITPHCIRSVQDLVSAFKDRQVWHLNSSYSQEDSLFDFSVAFSLSYLSFAVYYSYPRAGQAGYEIGSGRCCDLTGDSVTACHAYINHHKKVYRVLPGALVFLFGSPMYIILGPRIFNRVMGKAIKRFCWDIPPFCPEASELSDNILTDFTLVVSGRA